MVTFLLGRPVWVEQHNWQCFSGPFTASRKILSIHNCLYLPVADESLLSVFLLQKDFCFQTLYRHEWFCLSFFSLDMSSVCSDQDGLHTFKVISQQNRDWWTCSAHVERPECCIECIWFTQLWCFLVKHSKNCIQMSHYLLNQTGVIWISELIFLTDPKSCRCLDLCRVARDVLVLIIYLTTVPLYFPPCFYVL